MEKSNSIVSGTSLKIRIFLALGYFAWGVYSLRDIVNSGQNNLFWLIIISLIGSLHIWYISNSYVELNTEGIILSHPSKKIRISWIEITSVKLEKNMIYINYGGKQIGMTSYPKNRGDADILDFIEKECTTRKIEIIK